MAVAGKIVLTDSGKRGLRTTGKTAVFNSNGECIECCGVVCEYCESLAPKVYEVVFSDLLFWCLPGEWSEKLVDNEGIFDAPITLTHSEYCVWLGEVEIPAVVFNNRTCDGVVQSSTPRTISLHLEKLSDTSWLLSVYGSSFSGSRGLFLSTITGQPASCHGDLVFTNEILGYVPPDLIYAYGGTATVSEA